MIRDDVKNVKDDKKGCGCLLLILIIMGLTPFLGPAIYSIMTKSERWQKMEQR